MARVGPTNSARPDITPKIPPRVPAKVVAAIISPAPEKMTAPAITRLRAATDQKSTSPNPQQGRPSIGAVTDDRGRWRGQDAGSGQPERGSGAGPSSPWIGAGRSSRVQAESRSAQSPCRMAPLGQCDVPGASSSVNYGVDRADSAAGWLRGRSPSRAECLYSPCLLPHRETGLDANPRPPTPTSQEPPNLPSQTPEQRAPIGTGVRAAGRSAVGLRPSLDPDPYLGALKYGVSDKKKGRPTLLTGPAPSGMARRFAAHCALCKLLAAGRRRRNLRAHGAPAEAAPRC
jgi:hypothetical protein